MSDVQVNNQTYNLVNYDNEIGNGNLRFYPSQLPPFPLEPTKDRFAIKKVGDGVGEGVVTLKNINKGEIAFKFTGFIVNKITQYSLTIDERTHVHDPYFMGKVLHSCDPNTVVDMKTLTFTAVKDIKAGDLITMDYDSTEPILFKPFECECDAVDCKGLIKGYMA